MGLANEFDGVGLAVVFDGLAFTLDKLVQPFTLLAEKGQGLRRAGDDTKLESVRVLPHLDLRATDLDRAFGQHHTPGKHADLLEVVVTQGVGLDIHGLVAVGFFSQCRACSSSQEDCTPEREKRDFHKGTKLAHKALQ